jgi:hypothetical protein
VLSGQAAVTKSSVFVRGEPCAGSIPAASTHFEQFCLQF